jgi:hypothetical protein
MKTRSTQEEGELEHCLAFKYLRDEVTTNFEDGNAAGLAETARPLGGRRWNPSREIQHFFDTRLEELDPDLIMEFNL